MLLLSHDALGLGKSHLFTRMHDHQLDPRSLLAEFLPEFLRLVTAKVHGYDGPDIKPLCRHGGLVRVKFSEGLSVHIYAADSQNSEIRLIEISKKAIMHSQSVVAAEKILPSGPKSTMKLSGTPVSQ